MNIYSIKEAGRSMLEMLGVLAVVGALSIGGISSYRTAVNKDQSNKIFKNASLALAEVEGTRNFSSDWKPILANSGYIFYGKRTEYDLNLVKVEDVPEDVCEVLLELKNGKDISEIYADDSAKTRLTECEDNQKMVFLYASQKASTRARNTGTTENEEEIESEEDETSDETCSGIPYCGTYSVGCLSCQSCTGGRILTNNSTSCSCPEIENCSVYADDCQSCLVCTGNYVKIQDDSKSCVCPTISNCSAYNDDCSCSTCGSGYTLSSDAKTCANPCGDGKIPTSFDDVIACCTSTQTPYCYKYNTDGTCSSATCGTTGCIVARIDNRAACCTSSQTPYCDEYTNGCNSVSCASGTCTPYRESMMNGGCCDESTRTLTEFGDVSACCTSSQTGYCRYYNGNKCGGTSCASGTCTPYRSSSTESGCCFGVLSEKDSNGYQGCCTTTIDHCSAYNADCTCKTCDDTYTVGDGACVQATTKLTIGEECETNEDCESGVCKVAECVSGMCDKTKTYPKTCATSGTYYCDENGAIVSYATNGIVGYCAYISGKDYCDANYRWTAADKWIDLCTNTPAGTTYFCRYMYAYEVATGNLAGNCWDGCNSPRITSGSDWEVVCMD